nr:alpha/beta fold hydrolase [Thalassobacillus sp. CUG 92003]
MEEAQSYRFEGNEVGVLLIHGFTSTTQSVRPLGEAFAEAGYTVSAPRLEGHGTHYEDMEQTTYHDWVKTVESNLEWLEERCKVIFVAGLSMGGTLALYLAENHPEVKGVITINAAINLPEMARLFEKGESQYIEGIGSDINKPGVTELAYEKTPVASLGELVKLMGKVNASLYEIHCPALVFVSDDDHVVPPENSKAIFESVYSEHKELVHLENSYHVATLDYDVDLITERCLEFLQMYEQPI